MAQPRDAAALNRAFEHAAMIMDDTRAGQNAHPLHFSDMLATSELLAISFRTGAFYVT